MSHGFNEVGVFSLCAAFAALSLVWLVPGPVEAAGGDDVSWTDCQQLTIEGKGWAATKSFYDRLPAKAEGVVRPDVWGLSHDSAGYCVRFRTDAPSIRVKWELLSAGLAMPHMPATGMSGVDLYARDAKGGWHFVGTGSPTAQTDEATFYPPANTELTLYLPLYNGVKSVAIGVPAGKTVTKLDTPRRKPIVFYGTSITQGGCASRPGMCYTAIVGRKLDTPVINLGFSGNGLMEPELSDLLADLDVSVYVLDALWNMTPQMVSERVAPFVHKLRAAHPTTPILLAEDCTISNAIPTQKGKILRGIFEQLKREGVTGLYFVSAEGMMGPDDQGTVDGCHPTDLGFMYQAEVFVRALKPIFGK